MSRPFLEDEQLKRIKTLPASATTATCKGIPFGGGSNAQNVAIAELSLEAPACAVGELANSATHIYDLVHADTVDANGVMQSVSTLTAAILTQTGAGGAGAAAASTKVPIPITAKAFIGVKCTKSDSNDASAKSFTVKVLT